MGGRVAAQLALVAGRGEHLVVAGDHRADRHVAVGRGGRGRREGAPHQSLRPRSSTRRSIGQRQLRRSSRVLESTGPRSRPARSSDELTWTQIGAGGRLPRAGVRGAARARAAASDARAPAPARRRAGGRRRRRSRSSPRAPRSPSARRSCAAARACAPRRRTSSRTPPTRRSTREARASSAAGPPTSGAFGLRPGGIRAAAAWDRLIAAGRPGGAGVVVAVVDTGIAYQDSRRARGEPRLLVRVRPRNRPDRRRRRSRSTRTATAPTSPGRSPSRPPSAHPRRPPTTSPGSPTALR